MNYDGCEYCDCYNLPRGLSYVEIPNDSMCVKKVYCYVYNIENNHSLAIGNCRCICIEDDWYFLSHRKLVKIPNNRLLGYRLFFDNKELKFKEDIGNVTINTIGYFLTSSNPNRYLTEDTQIDPSINFSGDTYYSEFYEPIATEEDVRDIIDSTVNPSYRTRLDVKFDKTLDLDLSKIIKKTPKWVSSVDKLQGDIAYFNGFKISLDCYNELIANGTLVKCPYCKNYHYVKDAFEGFCKNCYINSAAYCEECGKLCDKNVLKQGLCTQCFATYSKYSVQRYGYEPVMKYYKDDGTYDTHEDSFSGIGIELEVDGGGENLKASKYIQELLNDEVYVKHDGSLSRGFEIITYPHTIKSFYKVDWKTALMDMIKHGYRSHDAKTCGLHMHISRNMLTRDELAKLIYFFESHKKDLIKFSRRDKEELSKWACFYTDVDEFRNSNVYGNQKITEKMCYDIISTYDDKFNHDYRYKAINLQKRPTIEFRLMRGTLNYKTFLATIDFLLKLIKNSKEISWDNVDNTNLWLNHMEDNTINYMKKRKCFGYDDKINEEESDL